MPIVSTNKRYIGTRRNNKYLSVNLAKIYIFVVHRVKFEFRIIFNHGKSNHMGIRKQQKMYFINVNHYQAVSFFCY